MIKKRRKFSRIRGRSSFYGHKKKHRGKGSRGGRGYGGSHKHKYSYIVSKEKDHYGYKGFYSRKKKGKTININELNKFSGDADLRKMGYTKLLSRGDISRAVTVHIDRYSKKAKEKIEKAGGRIEGAEERK